MKKLIIYISTALLQIPLIAQNLTVDQILGKVEQNEKIESLSSRVKQVITTSNGKQRTLEIKSYSKDFGESQLSVYVAPARVNGDKILMLNDGDDIWFYTPKTDRVRHIASSAKKQKVQGSDFSYEDMELWDYETDFTSNILGNEKINNFPCYKIELVPTRTGPHYSKMIIWVDNEKFITRQIEYYDDGHPLKILTIENIKRMDNYWIPMKYTMTSLIDGGSTIVENLEVSLNAKINDKMFTTNYLKQQ